MGRTLGCGDSSISSVSQLLKLLNTITWSWWVSTIRMFINRDDKLDWISLIEAKKQNKTTAEGWAGMKTFIFL